MRAYFIFNEINKFLFSVQTLPLHRNSGDNEDVACGTVSLRIESRDRITPPVSDLPSSSPVLCSRLSSVPSVPNWDLRSRIGLEESFPEWLEASELQGPSAVSDLEVTNQPTPSVQDLCNSASLPSSPVLELSTAPEPAAVELESALPTTGLVNPVPEVPVIEISNPPASVSEMRSSPPLPPPHERPHRQSSNRAPIPEPRRHRPLRPISVNNSRSTASSDVPDNPTAGSQTAITPECSALDAGSGFARHRRQACGPEVACGTSGAVIYRRTTSGNTVGASHHKRTNRPPNAVRPRPTTGTCVASLPDGYGITLLTSFSFPDLHYFKSSGTIYRTQLLLCI